MTMIDPTSRVSPRSHVFSREFDGEIVLLDLDAGVYYGLDAIATRVWKGSCDGGKTLEQVASDMVADFEVDNATLMKDLVALATEWVAKGLVEQVKA